MSNTNSRGSTADRRSRKAWLFEAYASDFPGRVRCFRCGEPLGKGDVTIDRIIPGSRGGTYARNNIRPACRYCNFSLGSTQKGR